MNFPISVWFFQPGKPPRSDKPVFDGSRIVRHNVPAGECQKGEREGTDEHESRNRVRFSHLNLRPLEPRPLKNYTNAWADAGLILAIYCLILDPKQAKDLTRQEREEVFRRSLKAMGLTEDGPMTPAQKDLVQRMYRTMVLGESGNRPPNQ